MSIRECKAASDYSAVSTDRRDSRSTKLVEAKSASRVETRENLTVFLQKPCDSIVLWSLKGGRVSKVALSVGEPPPFFSFVSFEPPQMFF